MKIRSSSRYITTPVLHHVKVQLQKRDLIKIVLVVVGTEMVLHSKVNRNNRFSVRVGKWIDDNEYPEGR